tara:strand:- start:1382 stop:1618 length:237 start_codon:yes stop_codon:yes gene_type:complete
MACGCGGRGNRNARKRRAASTPSARLRTARNRTGAQAQIAQRTSAQAIDPNSKPRNVDDKRRVEKLRRQAILRALGQL